MGSRSLNLALGIALVLCGAYVLGARNELAEYGEDPPALAPGSREQESRKRATLTDHSPHRTAVSTEVTIEQCCVSVIDAESGSPLADASIDTYICNQGETIEEACLRIPDEFLVATKGDLLGVFTLARSERPIWVRATAPGRSTKTILVHEGNFTDIEISLEKLVSIQVAFSPPLSEWAREGMELVCRRVMESGEVIPGDARRFAVSDLGGATLEEMTPRQKYLVSAAWQEKRLTVEACYVVAPGLVTMSCSPRRGLHVSVKVADQARGVMELRYLNKLRRVQLVRGQCWFDMQRMPPGQYSVGGRGEGWSVDPTLVTWSADDRTKLLELESREPSEWRILLSGPGYSDRTRLRFFELSGSTLIPLKGRVVRFEGGHVVQDLEALPRHLVVFDSRHARSYDLFCRGDEHEAELRLEESSEVTISGASDFVRRFKGHRGVAMLQVGIMGLSSRESVIWRTAKMVSLPNGKGLQADFWTIKVPDGVPCRIRVATQDESKILVLRE